MIGFNVAQLLKEPGGASRDFSFEEFDPELERSAGVRGRVQGRARLLRTSRGILATGDYSATIELVCGRCLETFLAPLSGTIEEEFLPAVDVLTGELLLREDGDESRITADHLLDLTDVIRQDILVRVPLRPLCEQACPGLCPECGAVRKREACACRPAVEESPFQVLARLLEAEGRAVKDDE